jgi:hypothetical protein
MVSVLSQRRLLLSSYTMHMAHIIFYAVLLVLVVTWEGAWTVEDARLFLLQTMVSPFAVMFAAFEIAGYCSSVPDQDTKKLAAMVTPMIVFQAIVFGMELSGLFIGVRGMSPSKQVYGILFACTVYDLCALAQVVAVTFVQD